MTDPLATAEDRSAQPGGRPLARVLVALGRLRWQPLILIVALQLVVAAFYMLSTGSGEAAGLRGFPLDEGWVRAVYARNFAQGFEFAFNPGEAEAGATSPLWVVLVGSAWKVAGPFGLGIDATARLLSIGFGLAASLLTHRLMLRLTGNSRTAVLAGAAVAVEPTFAFAVVSGMEVTLFAALALATVIAFMARRLRVAGVLLALMTLTRPEGFLVAAALGLALAGRRLWERSDLEVINRQDVRELVNLLLPTAVVLGVWGAYNYSINGGPFPNSYYVRHVEMGLLPVGNLMDAARGYFHHLPLFAGVAFPVTLLVLAVGLWAFVKRDGFLGMPLILFPAVLTYGIAITFPVSATAWTFASRRYLDAVVPFLIIGVLLGLAEFWRLFRVWRVARAPEDPSEAQVFNFALNVLFVGLVLMPFVAFAPGWQHKASDFSWNTRNVNDSLVAAADWIAENTAASDRIGVADAGAARFFSDRYIVDLTGRNWHGAIGELALELAEEEELEYLFSFRNVYFDSWPYGSLVYDQTIERNTILAGWTLRGYESTLGAEVEYGDPSQPQLADLAARGLRVLDEIDVGNVAAEAARSEPAHEYSVSGEGTLAVRTFRTNEGLVINDDARSYTGSEKFSVKSMPGERLVVLKRYDAAVAFALQVLANGQEVGLWQFDVGEFFFEEATFTIPAEFITGSTTELEFQVAQADGRAAVANSFYYWILVAVAREDAATQP